MGARGVTPRPNPSGAAIEYVANHAGNHQEHDDHLAHGERH
jgi:hypothetical protein